MACESNIAACYLNKKEYSNTKDWCKKVTSSFIYFSNLIKALQTDPKHTKSLWRLAKAHRALDEYDQAIDRLTEALKISDSKEFRNELIAVKKLRAEKNQADQKVPTLHANDNIKRLVDAFNTVLSVLCSRNRTNRRLFIFLLPNFSSPL